MTSYKQRRLSCNVRNSILKKNCETIFVKMFANYYNLLKNKEAAMFLCTPCCAIKDVHKKHPYPFIL
jgi:hypothetical protein